MNCTSEPHRIKSQNIIAGILLLVEELEKINDDILAQQQINQASIEQQHQAIEHIQQDQLELTAIRESNIEFIAQAKELVAKATGAAN